MDLLDIYRRLYRYFGSQHWWPAKTKLEVIIGTILTQNTSWQNVQKAIKNLKREKLLSIKKLSKVSRKRLEKCLKPSGYFKQKARRIKHFIDYLINKYNGNLHKLLKKPQKALRQELLSLNGIGEETADSIILYAAGKPSFVIDAYTKRFCQLFNIKFKTYQEYQDFFENKLPQKMKLYNEYHALIVSWGKMYRDKKTKKEAVKILKSKRLS